MATDKKHIAVYLDPAVELALVEFCEQKGFISKKGTMYSAGVNAALAAFFGVSISVSSTGNIPGETNNILINIPFESIDVETLRAENQRLHTELGNLRSAFPEPADLLNELKAQRRKATASLADMEVILEILEGT